MALVGRNDPCPCGSGKKFKKCCVTMEALAPKTKAADPNVDERSLLHELDGRIVEEIMVWARNRYGEAYTPFSEFPYEFDASGPDVDLFAPWSAYDYFVGDERVIDRYLAERGRGLSPQNREWLTAQSRAWVSAWEVLEARPNEGLRVRDLLTGETRFVREIKASRHLAPGDTLLSRVVDFRGTSVFCGTHSQKLSPDPAAAFAEAAAAALSNGADGQKGEATSIGRLRRSDASRIVIKLWKDATDRVAS